MEVKEIRKKILKVCMKKGFLLDREMLEVFSELDEDSAKEIIEKLGNLKIEERVITKKLFSKNFEKIKNVLIDGKSKTIIEKFFINLSYEKTEVSLSNISQENKEFPEKSEKNQLGKGGVLKILSSPVFPPKKIKVKDFVVHFRSRYELMRKILEAKSLEDLISIRKIGVERGNYTIIASILKKRITKNKNLILEVEDMTGNIAVLINQNKKELFQKAENLLVDDIVGFNVSGSSEILFANDVIFPEAGLAEKKYGKEDIWVAFSSDLHVGSSMFLEENFLRFIKWLNGKEGDEKQQEIAKKIKYLFLIGDNVDGVGVFPGQDKLLDIKDMKNQYDKLIELLKLIRKDIKIIICPGQHDAVWVGEPQPVIGEDWAPELYNMENVFLVANPALIEVDSGFKILMYHGASMQGIIEEIPEIRLKYGHSSPTRVVKEMLKRRHLAPMHGACDYIPCEQDPLAIREVPDILITGNEHTSEVSSYNNILLVSGSCWQSITPFEERVGHVPDPCKVPLFNLKTREIKILDFSDEEDLEEQRCEEKDGEVVCEVKK
jgi:DNA polymerase II small subunit